MNQTESQIVRKLWGNIPLPLWDARELYRLFRARREALERGSDVEPAHVDRIARLLMRLVAMRFKQYDLNFGLEDQSYDPREAAAYVHEALMRRTAKMRLRSETAIEEEDAREGRSPETARLPKEGYKLMLGAMNTTIRRLVIDFTKKEHRDRHPVNISAVMDEEETRNSFAVEDDAPEEEIDLHALARKAEGEVCRPLLKQRGADVQAIVAGYRYCLLWQTARHRMPTHDELPHRLANRLRDGQLTVLKARTRELLEAACA